ncbi:MAG TPA: hypothetical protein VFX57_05600, partial [Sulfuricurvum sp.]|nr:hypothetical protein [Sulfuricurvum sp.]
MTYRFLALFFLLCISLYSDTLQQTYPYTNSVIYSTDLSEGCSKRFEVLRIPEEKTSFRINAHVIAKTFELNGCSVDTGKIRFVNFVKQNGVDLSPLRSQVSALFSTSYPT